MNAEQIKKHFQLFKCRHYRGRTPAVKEDGEKHECWLCGYRWDKDEDLYVVYLPRLNYLERIDNPSDEDIREMELLKQTIKKCKEEINKSSEVEENIKKLKRILDSLV